MNGRRIDPDVVQAKLDLLEQTVATLERLGTPSGSELRDDLVTAAAAERLLSRGVELAVDVASHVVASRTGRAPDTYRAALERAGEIGAVDRELARRLADAAGMRNIIVHDYARVDHDVVADAIPMAIEDLRAFSTHVAAHVVSRDADQA